MTYTARSGLSQRRRGKPGEMEKKIQLEDAPFQAHRANKAEHLPFQYVPRILTSHECHHRIYALAAHSDQKNQRGIFKEDHHLQQPPFSD